MAEYRLYQIGIDGHFVGCEPLFCADDTAAIAKPSGRLTATTGARSRSFG
jgi:hypothetical protein